MSFFKFSILPEFVANFGLSFFSEFGSVSDESAEVFDATVILRGEI